MRTYDYIVGGWNLFCGVFRVADSVEERLDSTLSRPCTQMNNNSL